MEDYYNKMIGSLTDMEGETSEGNREQRSREGEKSQRKEKEKEVSIVYLQHYLRKRGPKGAQIIKPIFTCVCVCALLPAVVCH